MLHQLGWREWALSDGSALRRLDRVGRARSRRRSASSACRASPRGTACSCWVRRRRARPCFVSGAAGAVGSAAGQMARIAGCRVHRECRHGGEARVVLSRARLRWRLQLPGAEPAAALAELAPDGIDIYFDNVGGDHLEAAIGALALRTDEWSPVARSRATTTPSRRRGRGTCSWSSRSGSACRASSSPTTTTGSASSRAQAAGVGARGAAAGTARPMVEGIENAPKAFLGLLRGENIGKMLVKVGPDE